MSSALPPNLPVPQDDGAARGLPGRELPALRLESTAGKAVDLREAARDLLVLYVYPNTGDPPVEGWDQIPGARGCTPENCAFRDHARELAELGARVHGLSSQRLDEQRAFAVRERLPYPLLNDAALRLAEDPGLPTFDVQERGRTPFLRLYRRLTLIARAGRIEHVFYPVFPPDEQPAEVLSWLRRAA